MSTDTTTYQQPMETQQSEGDRSDSEAPLSKDQMFHLLSNQRRRDVLRYLAAHEGPVDMRDVAERVAAQEHDTTVKQLTSDERQRVYIALYQTHLPKLDDHGIIAYDQSRGVLERTERANQLDPYLDDSDETTGAGQTEPPAVNEYGLAVCVIGSAILVVGWLELLPAFALLIATWAALIAVVLTSRGIGRRYLAGD